MQNRYYDLGMPEAKEVAVGNPLLSKIELYCFTSIGACYCALISDDTFILTFSSEYISRDKTGFVVLNDFMIRGAKTLDLFYYGVRPLLGDIRHTMTGRPVKYLPSSGMRTEYDGALGISTVVYSSREKDDTFRKREKLAHIIPEIAT